MFVQNSDLLILRAPEATLKLTYKPIKCPDQTTSKPLAYQERCKKKQGLSLGLRTQLSKIIIDYEKRKHH